MRALLLAFLLAFTLGPAAAEPPPPIIAIILFEHCEHVLGIMFIRADGDYRMVHAKDLTADTLEAVKAQVDSLPPQFVHIVDDTVDCPET